MTSYIETSGILVSEYIHTYRNYIINSSAEPGAAVDPSEVSCGSCVSACRPDGEWKLALFRNLESLLWA